MRWSISARQAYPDGGGVKVSTLFCGSRKDPRPGGAITGLSDSNFTPENVVLGVLKGMAEELKEFYDGMDQTITGLMASGNAVRRNPVLRDVLADTFGMPVSTVEQEEEAAIGAALFAQTVC